MSDKIESRMHRMTETEKSVLARIVNDFGYEALKGIEVGSFGIHYGLVCVERAQKARADAGLPISAIFKYLHRVLSEETTS